MNMTCSYADKRATKQSAVEVLEAKHSRKADLKEKELQLKEKELEIQEKKMELEEERRKRLQMEEEKQKLELEERRAFLELLRKNVNFLPDYVIKVYQSINHY